MAVVFDHDLTSLEKADVANTFADYVKGGVNIGGTFYELSAEPAIIMDNEAGE